MNKNIFKIVLIISIAILQIILMPFFSIYTVVPNLILTTAIILILLDFEKEALLLAGLGGLLLDFFSPAFFGLVTIFLILTIFILRHLVKRVFPSINILIVAGTTFFFAVILSLLFNLILREKLSIIFLLASGIYNSVIAAIIFLFFHFQHKKLKLVKI